MADRRLKKPGLYSCEQTRIVIGSVLVTGRHIDDVIGQDDTGLAGVEWKSCFTRTAELPGWRVSRHSRRFFILAGW